MEQSDRSDNRPKLMVKVDKLMVNGDKLMVKVDREAGRPGAVFEAEFLVDAATAGHAQAHHHLGSGASRAGYSHLSLLNMFRFLPSRTARGLQMELTLLNLPTTRNLWDLTAISMELLFGRRRRANTSFFAWLLVQCKVLTADKLMARQWPCNPVCVLCNQEQEMAAHLVLHCPFARLVWERVQAWAGQLVQVPNMSLDIVDWWQKEPAHLPKKTRRTKAAFMLYCAWNIWKERNRRIF